MVWKLVEPKSKLIIIKKPTIQKEHLAEPKLYKNKKTDLMIYSFEKLTAYQSSRNLVKLVYGFVRNFPHEEKYVLGDQLRRSIISVPSNIAEQSGRTSVKEKVHFLDIAYGSLMEAYCQLDIAKDLGYLSETDMQSIKKSVNETSLLIYNLRRSLIPSLKY